MLVINLYEKDIDENQRCQKVRVQRDLWCIIQHKILLGYFWTECNPKRKGLHKECWNFMSKLAFRFYLSTNRKRSLGWHRSIFNHDTPV